MWMLKLKAWVTEK